MNRKKRFVIAVVLSIVFMLVAAGAWAAPQFQGTVPPPPVTGVGSCLVPVDMGTALITLLCNDDSVVMSVIVEAVENPAETYVPAPEGKTFTGDTFKVTTDPEDALIQICYAYPPEFSDKEAKINKLNEDATPNAWVEVPGAVINNGTICVTSAAGVFSLIGNP